MESRRYDGKLDNFLMQSLAEDEYERIATSEPCVVVCGEEKPAHKHAIVGHQHLYLTQFPPKKLKIAVQLEDVTSIQIVSSVKGVGWKGKAGHRIVCRKWYELKVMAIYRHIHTPTCTYTQTLKRLRFKYTRGCNGCLVKCSLICI